jgi:hypothetical protein
VFCVEGDNDESTVPYSRGNLGDSSEPSCHPSLVMVETVLVGHLIMSGAGHSTASADCLGRGELVLPSVMGLSHA